MENLNLFIPLNYPIGNYLIKPIKELKDNSLVFHISAEEGFVGKDTILENIKLFDEDHEKIIKKAKVIFCEKQVDEEYRHTWYKIGVEFLEFDKDFNKRHTRFNKELINNLKTKIFFKLNENEYRAELLNFSKLGVSLFIKNPKFILAKSDVLKNLKLEIDGKTFYEGDGVVVNIKNIELDIEIGVSFRDGHIPVDEISKLSTSQRVDFVFNDIMQEMGIEGAIAPEFKNKVNEFRYYLDVLKLKLDSFEKQLKKYPSQERYILAHNLLEKIKETSFNDLTKMLLGMDKLVSSLNLSKDDFEVYKKYYQNILHPLLLVAPIVHRIYTKPLGYAGDYEMMNMIYRDAYEGETLYAKLFNKYTSSINLSKYNRERIPYLLNKIKETVLAGKNNQKSVKITSIACGPAIEIQEFMKDELSNYCDFILLDVSSEALQYAKNRLNTLKQKYKRDTNFTFLQESVYDLIKKQESRDMLNDGQNMIYSSGLFEYLTEITVKRLIKVLFDKLNNEATLIIGNYSDEGYFKAFMDFCGEWFLFYRNETDLKNLASKIDSTKNIFVEKIGVLFLNIQK